MTTDDLETVYETLAVTIDTVEASKRSLFLSKLALLLANDLGDSDQVCARISAAAGDLEI